MKTLEQVQEHLKVTYYDCSEKICGYLVGIGLKDPKQVMKFLKEADYIYNFDDFLEWFEDGDESQEGFELSYIHSGLLEYFKKGKDEKCNCENCKCDKKAFKYQGEERAALCKEFDYKKEILSNLESMATYYSDKNILVVIDNLRKEVDELHSKLQEESDEK